MNTSHDAGKQDKVQPSPPSTGTLVLVRHTESEWNVLGKWTGRTDVHLTPKGRLQAAQLGKIIQDIELHHVYTSEQIRTVETLQGLLASVDHPYISHERSHHLNERDYGEYTGLNKWEVLEQQGEDVFTKIRRSWDHPIPGGETLEAVYKRAVPFYRENIVPKLLAGQNVLIISHGNTLRSLIKYLDDITDEDIAHVEMNFGEILLYQVTAHGKGLDKQVRRTSV